ncbi:MAG: glycosyltransferase family 2 protein, partial [Pseudomonadota bacterium]
PLRMCKRSHPNTKKSLKEALHVSDHTGSIDLYYRAFNHRTAPPPRQFSPLRQGLWQFCAMLMLGLALWYFIWRWGSSLNPDAMAFSIVVASAETAFFLGTILFVYDIWAENPFPRIVLPDPQKCQGSSVDIFVTTFDETVPLVEDSLVDACAVQCPQGWSVRVHLLDDGNRSDMRTLAQRLGVQYHSRPNNRGFKAGNLKNALLRSDGDFVVICDADTRLFSQFLNRTLGYFHDPKVAWVQTPHWFYDVPDPEPNPSPIKRVFGLGSDPFMVNPSIFFDVIQRRRDRHGASFCCGAGSVHRRDAICQASLGSGPIQKQGLGLQPFHFHVSEDIFTSIKLHGSASDWRSVYHPWVEARMLSPWSLDAWAAQKLKYAGGTYDIFLNQSAPWCAGMSWRVRLHYLSTFVSYLLVFPMLVLFFAPIVTMVTGVAPVAAYSAEFFVHLLPMAVAADLALLVGCKGYDIQSCRVLNLVTAPYLFRGFFQALLRRKIGFRPTPKIRKSGSEFRFVRWQSAGLAILVTAAGFGLFQYFAANPKFTLGLLIVNGFWLGYNAVCLLRLIRLGRWRPPVLDSPQERTDNAPAIFP